MSTPQAEMTLTDLYAPVIRELERVRACFDEEIRTSLPFVNELCEQIKRYRGKMLRPTLLLLAGRAAGELVDAHVTLAAVVEMVHVATLVHDDVLDEADVRRQGSTVNAMSGNETAVLLGDYLISHAFHLCSSLDSQFASREVGATTNRVCLGELGQIHHRGDAGLGEAEYLEIITEKTAALTGTCGALGARFAGACPEVVEALRCFGTELGVAFQIMDDVLDLVGSAERMGKTLGRDLDLGKPTLPVIHTLNNGDAQARARLQALIRGDRSVNPADMRELLERSGGIEYATGVAEGYVRTALSRLDLLPSSPAKSSLSTMAEFVIRRDY
ncbi:MAG: polyprenyl synthetase family protein [bacterium]|nr:polyprenyl synthetase family protein [bacterium]